MNRIGAGVLLVLGLVQMIGDAVGSSTLRGLGAAIGLAPAPRVFTSFAGFEPYSTRFSLEWRVRDDDGVVSLPLTPGRYARLEGPYNRRNIYGAALAGGPVLVSLPHLRPLFDAVARHGLCGEAPVLRELGVDPSELLGAPRLRYRPREGSTLDPRLETLEVPRWSNGWTGGQYSIYRVFLGLYLGVHYALLVPWGTELFSSRGAVPDASASPLILLFPNLLAVFDAPEIVTGLLTLGVGLAALLAIGVWDRAAAVALWYLGTCLIGRNPLILNPALPYLGWLLLAHAVLPKAPYGSWAARGRPDPAGDWHFPPAVHGAAWVLMAVGYSYSGVTKLVSASWLDGSALQYVLQNPLARPGLLRNTLLGLPEPLLQMATWGGLALEVGFAPLALSRRLRPWLWAGTLAMHVTLIALVDFADLSLGMVLLNFFTFDPAWLRSRSLSRPKLFYDGGCGLCHGFVRFAVAEDTRGAFRFAPLDGTAFKRAVAQERRAELPDSLVLVTADGAVRVRTDAVLAVLEALGGVWRLLSWVARLVPASNRDRAYDVVARFRRQLLAVPAAACPLLPVPLRRRFDA